MKHTRIFPTAAFLIVFLLAACGGAIQSAESIQPKFTARSGIALAQLASRSPIEARAAEPNSSAPLDTFALHNISQIATATPNPGQTGTPDLPQTYVAYDADFFSRPCPLFTGDDEFRAYACDFGEYYMLHKQATTRYSYYDADYTDGVVEANGYFNKGSGKYEYGIVFRANPDRSEYYVFTVTNDGRYNVALYKDNTYTDLIPYTASDIVNTDEAGWNTFRVVMRGSRLNFYLNDEFLDTVTDSSLDRGVVGFFFYNDTPDTEVGFDQLTISTFEPVTPTPTPNAVVASPTAGAASALPETFVAFDADFFGDECPLFEGDNDTRAYGCDVGEYYMLHKEAATRYTFLDEQFDDAVVEAYGFLNRGNGKYEYGIVFRANSDGSAYYVFTVTNDGKYNVSLYKDEKFTDLIPYTSSPLVNTGSGANAFKVVSRGSMFDFYLNGEFLDTVTDDSLASGVAGLFFSNDTPDTEVGFDQFTISTFEPPAVLTPSGTVTPSTPTSNLPETYVAFDADFFGDECPLFQGENDARAYGCELGTYEMLHKEATTRYTIHEAQYRNGVVEANGFFIKGSGKYEYGIVFRANDEGSEYYVFTVTNDGRYNVALYKDDKYTDLIPYTSSPIVNIGDNANNLRVVMRGSTFDFYLNDTFLDSVTNSAIPNGVAGLFFYNDTPDVAVGFDRLTISTFEPPAPTATPEPTTGPATPTAPSAAPTVAVRPGVYVTGLRFAPGAPKRGDPVTFYPTFLNTTGREQNYKWLVEIWEANTDKKNPYGQADHREQLIPTSINERATGDSFKVAGGGPCIAFRAHVVFIDDQGRRVPFLRTNGTELWVPFQICP